MFKNLLVAILATASMATFSSAFAATDINKATQAELESVKGIGPSMSTRILDERKKNTYKNWDDFINRVSGVGPGSATKFSADGLTVNGETFKGTNSTSAKNESKAKVQPKLNKEKATKS